MRKLHQNLKAGEIKLAPDTIEDLWYLSTIIDPDDVIEARSTRKVKLGEEGDSVKKTVFAIIRVEGCELSGDMLRIAGVVVGGSDELPRGTHHSIKAELHEPLLIHKEEWLRYQLDKVGEACAGGPAQILILLHDREEAYFAAMNRTGYDVLAHITGEPAKKEMQTQGKDFYAELGKHLLEYDKRYTPARIIIASPAFFKEDLLKTLPAALKGKVILATASSVGKNGIDEVLKRDETKTALAAHKSAQELKDVETLFAEIAKDGAAAYGWSSVREAGLAGAVKQLLITEGYIKSRREEKTYAELDMLMRSVDRSGGSLRIISLEHDGGKRLNGLGGIGAMLRYRMH
ncbi:mRNA surveillance protein pelota [Candidatus Woesearchaeota archaeon]|nr:mRNA surveillance protein pelota [Candidatus Woesearchaeota archaeon]